MGWWRRGRFEPVTATVVGHRQTYVRQEENPNYWQLLTVFEFETADGVPQRAECPAAYTTDRGDYPRFHTGERVEIGYDLHSPQQIAVDQPKPITFDTLRAWMLPTWLWRELYDERQPRTTSELLAHLHAASADTPYRITDRENRFGRAEFIIELDSANGRWRPIFERHGFGQPFLIRGWVRSGSTRIEAFTQLTPMATSFDPPVSRWPSMSNAVAAQFDRDFGRAGRIAEFGDRPDQLHSFSAIEALGWLWRESHAMGYEPPTNQSRRALDALGILATAVVIIGAALWGLLELILYLCGV